MAKTTFSSGVIVTSQFLNGFQQIYFDGADLDHHYNPLGLNSLVTSGPNGLDTRYLTLNTDQPVLSPLGLLVSGAAVTGNKVITGAWNFGFDNFVIGNPTNNVNNAPKSFVTNQKFNYANGIVSPTIVQKFAALAPEDLVTKEILDEWTVNIQEVLEIDNGVYYSSVPTCENYDGGSPVVCPL